jgi:hypothetical protein
MNYILLLLVILIVFVLWGSKEHFYYLRRYDEELVKIEQDRKKCIDLTNDIKGCDEEYFAKLKLLGDLKENTIFYHLYYPGYRNHRYTYYSRPFRGSRHSGYRGYGKRRSIGGRKSRR